MTLELSRLLIKESLDLEVSLMKRIVAEQPYITWRVYRILSKANRRTNRRVDKQNKMLTEPGWSML